MTAEEIINMRCVLAADVVVPAYRSPPKGRSYSCGGIIAKRWQAAYDGARAVLTDAWAGDAA